MSGNAPVCSPMSTMPTTIGGRLRKTRNDTVIFSPSFTVVNGGNQIADDDVASGLAHDV